MQDPYVVSVGRLIAQKDHGTLLRAYASSGLRRDYRLIVIGDGPERNRLQMLAEDLGIQDRVDLPGALSNPYPLLSGAALHVLSSRWEGYPNVLLESLALGVPVVATDCPSGPRELLRDGSYGHLVPVGDIVAMAHAMDEAVNTSGKYGIEVLALHHPQAIIANYLAILDGDTTEGF